MRIQEKQISLHLVDCFECFWQGEPYQKTCMYNFRCLLDAQSISWNQIHTTFSATQMR